nr:MAG TPA: hypothetical protein [Caudoviricetes sp.]
MVSGSKNFFIQRQRNGIGFQMMAEWETYPGGLPPMGSSFPLRS